MNGSKMPMDTVFWKEFPSTSITQCVRMREHRRTDVWSFEDNGCDKYVQFICEDS